MNEHAQVELAEVLTAVNVGFAGVHTRIDTFKDQFHDHQLACGKLFEEIHKDEAARMGAEKEKARSLQSRINWSQVRTVVTAAVLTLIAIAAVKIIFTNMGKFAW